MRPRPQLAARFWGLLMGVDGSAPQGWSRPRPDRPGLIRDACAGLGIALVIAGAHWAIVGSGILSSASDLDAHQPLWLRVVAPLAFGLVVAVRRRLPVTALIMGTAVFFGFLALGYLELFVTPYVYFYILYSAGAWSSQRTLVTVLRLLITGGVGVAMIVNLMSLSPDAVHSLNIEQPASFGVWASIINLLFFLGGIWLGNSEYLRAGQRATMDAQVAQLHASRAQLADQAVRLDRLRIARELHDSVAHHVSLMGVQAAVARRTLEVGAAEAAPHSVVTALEGVETSARDAVSELQSVLVTLRSEDEDAPLSNMSEGCAHPGDAEHRAGAHSDRDAQRGGAGAGRDDVAWHGDAVSVPSTWTLAQVPALVDQVRASGMVIDCREVGQRDPLILGTVELTLYRVLQEALTNVRKHAGANANVQVRIRHHSGWVGLDVMDDGRGIGEDRYGGDMLAGRSASDASAGAAARAGSASAHWAGVPGGRGILGMEERAQAVGGVLRAGPRTAGGFRVQLRVPSRSGAGLEGADMEAEWAGTDAAPADGRRPGEGQR